MIFICFVRWENKKYSFQNPFFQFFHFIQHLLFIFKLSQSQLFPLFFTLSCFGIFSVAANRAGENELNLHLTWMCEKTRQTRIRNGKKKKSRRGKKKQVFLWNFFGIFYKIWLKILGIFREIWLDLILLIFVWFYFDLVNIEVDISSNLFFSQLTVYAKSKKSKQSFMPLSKICALHIIKIQRPSKFISKTIKYQNLILSRTALRPTFINYQQLCIVRRVYSRFFNALIKKWNASQT